MRKKNIFLIVVLCCQVSWIRRRDWHIMSVGDTVYTTDDRVVVNHREDTTDWILQFKFVRERDEGIYECQVRLYRIMSGVQCSCVRYPWLMVR